MSWKDFKKEYLGKKEAAFNVQFAWSVWSCLVKGYPDGKECITLKHACKTHKVSVVIDSEEEGVGFEEHVMCNHKGVMIYREKTMPTYIWKKCGNEQTMPSDCDREDQNCYNCGEGGEWKKQRKKK